MCWFIGGEVNSKIWKSRAKFSLDEMLLCPGESSVMSKKLVLIWKMFSVIFIELARNQKSVQFDLKIV